MTSLAALRRFGLTMRLAREVALALGACTAVGSLARAQITGPRTAADDRPPRPARNSACGRGTHA